MEQDRPTPEVPAAPTRAPVGDAAGPGWQPARPSADAVRPWADAVRPWVDAVRPWVDAVRRNPSVRGVLLAGGIPRGDAWSGSDVDLYVVWADESRADTGRPEAGARFTDVHHVTASALAALLDDARAFGAAPVVDETAGGLPLYDADGTLRRWLDGLSERLADPMVRRARGAARLAAGRSALAAAQAEPDPLEAALLARDAARWAAWAHVAACGGLVCSARRFADRFLAASPPEMGQTFRRAWALGGGRPAVDAAVAALREAIRDALAVAASLPPRAGEHHWIMPWREAGAAGHEAFLARHPLPALLDPALAAGFFDGSLLWMRGYYALTFRDLRGNLPPGRRPEAALRRFHGLTGRERAEAGAFVRAVEAALGAPPGAPGEGPAAS